MGQNETLSGINPRKINERLIGQPVERRGRNLRGIRTSEQARACHIVTLCAAVT